MLNEWLTKEMVQFSSETLDWQQAIQLASHPLLDDGRIEPRYIHTMIKNVEKFGPYIVLMPEVAMPHARPEDGVLQVGMSLLVSEKGISFPGGKEAKLFFVLAANDPSSHLTLLMTLSTFLSDETNVQSLLVSKTYSDVKSIFNSRGKNQ